MILNTPQIMLSMTHLTQALGNQLEARCSTPHCSYKRTTYSLKTRVSRKTHQSKTHYTNAQSDDLIGMSFTTHHHRATHPHSKSNLHQFEVSHYTHHFSSICSSNFGIY